jgi:hypothetical protein
LYFFSKIFILPFADVSAKDGSQETAVNFVALVLSLALVPLLQSGNESADTHLAWTLFLCTAVLHIFCNYKACRAVHLPTMNPRRLTILVQSYFFQNSHAVNRLPSPADVALTEDLFLLPWPSSQDMNYLTLRRDAKNFVCSIVVRTGEEPEHLDSRVLDQLAKIFSTERYLISLTPQPALFGFVSGIKVHILLSETASREDEIKANFLVSVIRLAVTTEEHKFRTIGEQWSRPMITIRARVLSALSQPESDIQRLMILCDAVNITQDFVSEVFGEFSTEASRVGWDMTRHHFAIGDWKASWL